MYVKRGNAMTNVKWIKLVTGFFNNRKIKQIKKMPEGKSILLIWINILCLAGDINDNGLVYLTKDTPYNEETLATEFDEDVKIIRLALQVFERFQMIEIVDNFLLVSNWEKYQNVKSLDDIREQTRKRVANYRKRQKELISNVTVTLRNETEKIREDKIREDKKRKDNNIDTNVSMSVETDSKALRILEKTDFDNILDYWNKTSMLKEISAITEKRKGHINARYKEHGLEAIYIVIKNCGQSNFMRGDNNRGWQATFDWVFRPNNFIKVLEGNYLDSKKNTESKFEKTYRDTVEELERSGY